MLLAVMCVSESFIVLNLMKHTCNQGCFCDGSRRNAVPEVLSQKDTSRNGVQEPLFAGIDVSSTSPSPTEFWVTVCSLIYLL
jgi:hypothetical protein